MNYSKERLIETLLKGEEVEFLHFWGHRPSKDGRVTVSCFSQWWMVPFTVGKDTYKSAEHWMMAGKARLFRDAEMLNEIIACETPGEAKKLGRKVRNWDFEKWNANKFEIVVQGNVHKFSQHPELKAFLLATGDQVIVEASPRDKIWGIGMGKSNPDASNPQKWKGPNLLGFALMETRDRLRNI